MTSMLIGFAHAIVPPACTPTEANKKAMLATRARDTLVFMFCVVLGFIVVRCSGGDGLADGSFHGRLDATFFPGAHVGQIS